MEPRSTASTQTAKSRDRLMIAASLLCLKSTIKEVIRDDTAATRLRTTPGLPETIWFKLCRHGGLFQHAVVALFGFCRWNVTDGLPGAAGC